MGIKDLSKNDKTYWELSDKVYRLYSEQSVVKLHDGDKVIPMKIRVKRIDKNNGFKAMAVSPIDEQGKVDNDTIYMTYAGTSIYEDIGADLGADLSILAAHGMPISMKMPTSHIKRYADLNQTVIKNKQLKGNVSNMSQFEEAMIWTKSVRRTFKPKKMYGTGHSLGGGQSLLMGVIFNFDKVRVYSAPNIFKLLPIEIQKHFDNDKYKNKFVNYVHTSDAIGSVDFGSPDIGKKVELYASSRFGHLFHGHGLDTFKFIGNHLIIKMDYDNLELVAQELANKIFFLEKELLNYHAYIENSVRRAKQIERKYIDIVSNGNYEYIHSGDIENYVAEISKSGKYDFYDKYIFEEIQHRISQRKQRLIEYSQQIHQTISKMKEVEHRVGDYFGLQ